MTLRPGPEADTEQWDCPVCGRVMLVRWAPDFEYDILRVGDERAIHAGGKGGARIGSVDLAARNGEPERATREWLAEQGIAWDDPAA